MNRNPLHELAGVDERRILRPRRGLTERESAELCRRINEARLRASMSPRTFRSMDRRALRVFCATFNFSAAEVRLAQCLAQLVRSMCRTQALSDRVRAAMTNPNAGVRYQ
jgi:hypothetical protein